MYLRLDKQVIAVTGLASIRRRLWKVYWCWFCSKNTDNLQRVAMLEQQRRSVASAVAQWRGKIIKTEEGEGQEVWPATAAWFLGPKVKLTH